MTANYSKLQIDLDNERATQLLAQDIALSISKGDCIALAGDLGAGKTTLARAIIRSVAEDEYLEVPSPTFTLVQQYDLRILIGHFDLYRTSDPDELSDLGLDDILDEGVALIEWPEMANRELPNNHITMKISGLESERRIEIYGPANFMERLDRSLVIRDFLIAKGLNGSDRTFLQGDASTRTYERVRHPDFDQMILMNSPKQSDGPVIKDGKTYSEIAHLAEDVVPFVAIAGLLRELGLTSPEIIHASIEKGILIVEDLGNQKTIDNQNIPIPERYMASMEVLAYLHGKSIKPEFKIDDNLTHNIPRYDEDIMQMEIELLPDWYIPYKTGKNLEKSAKNELIEIWQSLFQRLHHAEKSLVLRDYHSPNIIWQPNKTGLERVGIIDFQDALIGPCAYDVASLAQDARVSVSEELEQNLIKHYSLIRKRNENKFDVERFNEAYAIMAAQRASKVIGIFVRLKERDGKVQYLRHIPRIEDYLRRLCQYPVLRSLRDWLDRYQVL